MRHLLIFLLLVLSMPAAAQYVVSTEADSAKHTLYIYVDTTTHAKPKARQKAVKKIAKQYRGWNIIVASQFSNDQTAKQPGGHRPWTTTLPAPTAPLYGRHIALWASHGMYYDNARNRWEWQRPLLFGTREDWFTRTFVCPYLIPMLQRAGAVVFTPRERDEQTAEVILDDTEALLQGQWTTIPTQGFAHPTAPLHDGDNPFTLGHVTLGTALQTKTKHDVAMVSDRRTSAKHEHDKSATYAPTLPRAGRYAVYVSYATLPCSTSDARYTIVHRGVSTTVSVNQQMGGGTWVYLGTYDFDTVHSPARNAVVLTAPRHAGTVVTTDAVRFGGGMGNIVRGDSTSRQPRYLEGARYYAQWAGAPRTVYAGYDGNDDYRDDINTRSLMINWLADSLHVPFDLCLAVHSDAGYNTDGSLYGSLAICTTDSAFRAAGDTITTLPLLRGDTPRQTSYRFAQALLQGLQRDLTHDTITWPVRDLYDRNYSETRLPCVPSAIIETLSHESAPDMHLGLQPAFRCQLARSLYKTMLRYLEPQATVAPLPPQVPTVTLDALGNATITWQPTHDPLEPTATPTGYNIYIAHDDNDFEPHHTTSPAYTFAIHPGHSCRIKLTATNTGGESLDTSERTIIYP